MIFTKRRLNRALFCFSNKENNLFFYITFQLSFVFLKKLDMNAFLAINNEVFVRG